MMPQGRKLSRETCFKIRGLAPPVLSSSIKESLQGCGAEGEVLVSLRRKEDDLLTFTSALGALYATGCSLDWSRACREASFVRLPSYPWQRERHWNESYERREDRLGPWGPTFLGTRRKQARPLWQLDVDLNKFAWLKDHRIQGQVVYPGAAYVEMALEAAHDLLGEGVLELEEVEFQRALVLQEASATQVQLDVDEDRQTFEIHSRSDSSTSRWRSHAKGSLASRQDLRRPQAVSINELREACGVELPVEDVYRQLHGMGLQYGPEFQDLERLWRGEGEALGRVGLRGCDGREPLLDPRLLDGCFQSLLAVMPERDRTWLPVRLGRLRLYKAPEGSTLWSHARLVRQSGGLITGDILLLDCEGRVVAEIRELRLQALADDPAGEATHLLHAYRWQEVPRSGEWNKSADLPSPSELKEALEAKVERLTERLDRSRYYAEVQPAFDSLCLAYILEAFKSLGWAPQAEDRFSIDALAEQLRIAGDRRQLLGRFLEMFEEEGLLCKDDGRWRVAHTPESRDPRGCWRAILERFPAYEAELLLQERCGRSLAEILRGEVDPLELIFPEGSTALLGHLYQDAPSSRVYNSIIQETIRAAVQTLPEERPLRILEIGAGTGGMTAHVLSVLPSSRTEYVFTDVSERFIAQAEQKLAECPFVEYRLLDIEKDPVEQGLDAHSFDLILAFDVLHATRDLRCSLSHVLRLLAPRGQLMLLELTRRTRWLDLVFGSLEGWWRFSDSDLRPSHPLLSGPEWQGLLEDMGFDDVAGLSDTEDRDAAFQTVLLARGPELSAETAGEEEVSTGEPAGTWLLFDDNQGVGQRLSDLIRARGESVLSVCPGPAFQRLTQDRFSVRLDAPEDFRLLLEEVQGTGVPCRGVLHLWSLDAPLSLETTPSDLDGVHDRGVVSALHLVQALSEGTWSEGLPVWLITRGVHVVGNAPCSSMAQAPLWGFGRVVANERPALKVRLVDLGSEDPSDEVRSLYEEIHAGDTEDEIALRGALRYVHRLLPVLPTSQRGNPGCDSQDELSALRLEITRPGALDNLRLSSMRQTAPGPGEVGIEVHAAALNFLDVAKTMGLLGQESFELGLSGLSLGVECSGTINAVGPGVSGWSVGDSVIALAPHSLGQYAVADVRLVVPKPEDISFEAAASTPIVFLTAWYALHHLARLGPGERVLIHSAAGGVGLAAIQLARRTGAEVFATAGSQQKRDFLKALGVEHVMDSRSVDFVDQVLEETDGKGVDVVLNSLAGEAIPKSISVLAPYGRFVEIGKRDIAQNRSLGLRPFRRNLSYFAVDVDQLMQDRPDFLTAMLREVLEGFRSRSLFPLPHRVFPISGAVEAFRYMAQASHIGKIVISLKDCGGQAAQEPPEPARLRSDATWLITGGLGGFGLATARWLVDRGVRHLLLMGREGAATKEATDTLSALRGSGAAVRVVRGDVTEEADVRKVLDVIESSMPPLKGIVHAAMVLDDSSLTHLDAARMKKVLGPKIHGAWNLHRQTLYTQLDYFLLYSSVTSLVGNPGQANYVAGNAFLDALAHYRRSLGLPALTVNWGAISDAGHVSQHSDIGERLERLGTRSLDSRTALEQLAALLGGYFAQVAVAPMDWQRWGASHASASSPRLRRVTGDHVSTASSADAPSEKETLQQTILSGSPEERKGVMDEFLRAQTARVIGTSVASLDSEKPLTDLGLDSLMAVELSFRLSEKLGMEVTTMELFGGGSISQLRDHLLALLASQTGIEATTDDARNLQVSTAAESQITEGVL